MPKGNPRGWRDVNRARTRSRQIFEQLEETPDLSRAEQRLAAEIALAHMRGQLVPSFAHGRAIEILSVMAKG